MDETTFRVEIQTFSERWFSITLTDHQLEWLWFIHNNPWVLLLAPRGHGKTTIIIVYITWLICSDPDLRILIGMHKEEDADERARAIQIILETPAVQEEYGLIRGRPWTIGKAFFEGKRHPYMRTVAKQAGMTGWRGDIVFFDDLCTEENQSTEKRRRKLENWIWGEVMPALDPGPKQRVIVLGTRKNVEDWYSKVFEIPDFKHRIYKIYEDDDPNKALWPERFTLEEIERIRRNWPPDYFSREYLNSPVVESGLLFRLKWIEPHFYLDWRAEVPERFREIYMGIDPSMGSDDERYSHFGLVVICYDNRPEKKDIYVVDIVRARLSLPEQRDIIIKKFREWNPIHVNIEEELANRQFSRQMRVELPRLRPVFYTYKGKTTGLRGSRAINKTKRISQIFGMLCEAGKIRFRDPKVDRDTRDFLNYEYLQFPEGNLDCMDALNMAVDLVDFRKTVDGSPLVWIQ